MDDREPDQDSTASDDEGRAFVFKASLPEEALIPTMQVGPTTEGLTFEAPPIHPRRLLVMVENSGIVRPCVDSYVTNIESRGHYFTPALNLDSPGVEERIASALFVERLLLTAGDLEEVPEPTPEEVAKKQQTVKRLIARDQARAESFFSGCTPDGTFTDLRRMTRNDLEATGNAYWEILRGQDGTPKSLVRVPSVTMRLGRLLDEEVEILEQRRATPFTWEPIRTNRRFKKFCQVNQNDVPVVWFKEFGDPRIVSQKSGDYFVNAAALLAKEGAEAKEATEIMHWEIPCGTSSYGLPRWIGNTPAVLGSRELDESNLDYFFSNAVPALAILVAGGRLSAGQVERLKEFFENEVRGRKATNKTIVLEAMAQRRAGGEPSPVPKIEFVPLRDAQASDALFQTYDTRNEQKVSASFRLPVSVATGRSPSFADLRFAEEQVYEPEREAFDAKINKFLMPALGINYVAFTTNEESVRDPEVVGSLTVKAAEKGIIVPDEARAIMSDVLDIDLPPAGTTWAKQPIPMTLASLGVVAGPAAAVREQGRQAGDEAPQSPLLDDLGLKPQTDVAGGRKLGPLRGLPRMGTSDDDAADEK